MCQHRVTTFRTGALYARNGTAQSPENPVSSSDIPRFPDQTMNDVFPFEAAPGWRRAGGHARPAWSGQTQVSVFFHATGACALLQFRNAKPGATGPAPLTACMPTIEVRPAFRPGLQPESVVDQHRARRDARSVSRPWGRAPLPE